jgi:hypothetical protein
MREDLQNKSGDRQKIAKIANQSTIVDCLATLIRTKKKYFFLEIPFNKYF